MSHRIGRWLSPAALLLAALAFVLPFVTVSCDAPGGYGRAAMGGTTTYNGVDLAIGGKPDVSPAAKLRTPDQQRDDRIGPEPLALVTLVLIGAGLVAAIRIKRRTARRETVAVVATGAVLALAANQAVAQADIKSRLTEQLTVPMPAGHQAGDYVHTAGGFWLCLALLVVTAVANAVGWLRTRPRARPADERPVSDATRI